MHKTDGVAQVVLATLNARYIHASLGLRCLLANLDRHGGAGLRAQALLREYTISRAAHEVVADLLATLGPAQASGLPESPPLTLAPCEPSRCASTRPPIVGFGVYIWNVTQTTEVIRLLKAARPDVVVVLGGPEVSHETGQQAITQLADHVITGWGEVSFARLCRALLDGQPPPGKIIIGEQPALAELELPYAEYSDADLAHRLLYVEASRGCPFKCAFCLSALDQTAWAFAPERVLAALEDLYQRGARNFKFVDRTFNLKIEHSARILQFFLDKLALSSTSDAPAEHHRAARSLFLHFEVIPDHLPERLKALLAQFAPGVLQLEVGVQSFNVAVQHTISRRQDNAATEANLRWLLAHSHAHLHADLIFGLPGESLASFAAGFDRLLAIGPHEIQLGLLKRLRGAPITRLAQMHGLVFAAEPPYTVLQTGVLDAASVQAFARFARYWDLLANSGRFTQTLALWLQPDRVDPGQQSPFWRFMQLSERLWQRLGSTHRLTPEVLLQALLDELSGPLPLQPLRQALLADYQTSGARANPKALHGLLPRPAAPIAQDKRTLATRQARHQLP